MAHFDREYAKRDDHNQSKMDLGLFFARIDFYVSKNRFYVFMMSLCIKRETKKDQLNSKYGV